MKKNISGVFSILLIFVLLSLLEGAGLGAEPVTKLGNAAQSAPTDCTALSAIELPMPIGDGEKNYLGLPGSGNFKIGQINGQVLIIEVYSFYCPHCQRMAAQVNDLYSEIQKRPDLKEKIKMIGIGASNSAYEVEQYRERYHVPFPLFPDKELDIAAKLCVNGTPTFIGVKMDGKGSQDRFYFGEGGFQDIQKFLAEIVQSSGIK